MTASAKDVAKPAQPSDGDASVSSDRAVKCPRCGGELQKRTFGGGGGTNPFLAKKKVARVVCVDCGLDGDALERHGSDPW